MYSARRSTRAKQRVRTARGLYAPAPFIGSSTGRLDSRGYIVEIDYLPWEKLKLTLQYTVYNKFNGSNSGYDGFGRSASDNNTLYLAANMHF